MRYVTILAAAHGRPLNRPDEREFQLVVRKEMVVNLFQFRKHWGSKRYRDYSKKVVTKILELSWIIPWRQSNKLVKFFSKTYFTLIHSREIDFLGKR